MADFPAMAKYVGQTAARYDEVRRLKATTQRDQITVENYLAKLAPGDRVLDLPAGTGRFIEFCVRHGLHYTGVDISADMLDVAKAKIPAGATNIDLRVADARALPFANDAFDHAIVVKFIKWLPTLETVIDVLREIGRVTRKEILVQIKVVQKSRSPFGSRLTRVLNRLRLTASVSGQLDECDAKAATRAYSEQELMDAFSAAGLHIHSVLPDPSPLEVKLKKNRRRNERYFFVLSKQPIRYGPPAAVQLIRNAVNRVLKARQSFWATTR